MRAFHSLGSAPQSSAIGVKKIAIRPWSICRTSPRPPLFIAGLPGCRHLGGTQTSYEARLDEADPKRFALVEAKGRHRQMGES